MVEVDTLQDRCDSRIFSPVWLQILNLPTGINVMNKYRGSTINVPVCAENRSGYKKKVPLFWRGPAVFKGSNFQYGENTRIGCAWQSQFISHKNRLDHKNV